VSNPFAIAAVTTTWSQLLHEVASEPTLSGTTVTVGPPDRARLGSTGRQLNVFLYRVTPNAAWRNMDLPSRGAAGQSVARPVLALDLHYLLTAYGHQEEELDTQHLLAHAMSLTHDNSMLTRDRVRAAVAAEPAVAAADLAEQIELVKLVPEVVGLEEISRLWATFQATSYRLSVGYEASVVLIERPGPARTALPVRTAAIVVAPFVQPVVETVTPMVAEPGTTLTVTGHNLAAPSVKVRVGTDLLDPTMRTERRLRVVLPASASAGISAVQVIHHQPLGRPPVPHPGPESNLVAITVVPRITTASPLRAAPGTALAVAFAPPARRSQKVALLVGDREIVPDWTGLADPASSLNFVVPADIAVGSHLLRLRIDGGQSALQVDTTPASPTFNQYIGPQVTVTK
jgi:hypothetical protein